MRKRKSKLLIVVSLLFVLIMNVSTFAEYYDVEPQNSTVTSMLYTTESIEFQDDTHYLKLVFKETSLGKMSNIFGDNSTMFEVLCPQMTNVFYNITEVDGYRYLAVAGKWYGDSIPNITVMNQSTWVPVVKKLVIELSPYIESLLILDSYTLFNTVVIANDPDLYYRQMVNESINSYDMISANSYPTYASYRMTPDIIEVGGYLGLESNDYFSYSDENKNFINLYQRFYIGEGEAQEECTYYYDLNTWTESTYMYTIFDRASIDKSMSLANNGQFTITYRYLDADGEFLSMIEYNGTNGDITSSDVIDIGTSGLCKLRSPSPSNGNLLSIPQDARYVRINYRIMNYADAPPIWVPIYLRDSDVADITYTDELGEEVTVDPLEEYYDGTRTIGIGTDGVFDASGYYNTRFNVDNSESADGKFSVNFSVDGRRYSDIDDFNVIIKNEFNQPYYKLGESHVTTYQMIDGEEVPIHIITVDFKLLELGDMALKFNLTYQAELIYYSPLTLFAFTGIDGQLPTDYYDLDIEYIDSNIYYYTGATYPVGTKIFESNFSLGGAFPDINPLDSVEITAVGRMRNEPTNNRLNGQYVNLPVLTAFTDGNVNSDPNMPPYLTVMLDIDVGDLYTYLDYEGELEEVGMYNGLESVEFRFELIYNGNTNARQVITVDYLTLQKWITDYDDNWSGSGISVDHTDLDVGSVEGAIDALKDLQDNIEMASATGSTTDIAKLLKDNWLIIGGVGIGLYFLFKS